MCGFSTLEKRNSTVECNVRETYRHVCHGGDGNTQFVQLLRCADSGQRGPEGEARPAQVPHQGNFSELQLHSIHVLKCHIKATEMQLQ